MLEVPSLASLSGLRSSVVHWVLGLEDQLDSRLEVQCWVLGVQDYRSVRVLEVQRDGELRQEHMEVQGVPCEVLLARIR